MPEFIHNRAEHILAKNPDMPKSQAFAIATQQSHALGKSPKRYGTVEGRREARAKYTTPKDDVRTANPGSLNSPKLAAAPLRAKLKLLGSVALASIGASAMDRSSDAAIDKAIGAYQHRKKTKQASSFVDEIQKMARERFRDQVKVGQGIDGMDFFGDEDMESSYDRIQPSSIPPLRVPSLKKKAGFAVSQYSGPLSHGAIPSVSYIPPFTRPPLRKVSATEVEKTAYSASGTGKVHLPGMRKMPTPAGSLAASKGVATVPATPPGPSIAQISKPSGFGKPMPGAVKTPGDV
jgi:hypothetical protein